MSESSHAKSLWSELASRADRVLSDAQRDKLVHFLDLLIDANQRMNLTRITDRAAAEVQHVGDALTLLPHLPNRPHTIADVGSGGGVPGIPLAIVRPDVTFLLIESTRKKAAYLREAAASLGLLNLQVAEQRAEDVGRSDRRETFDIAVARAVATMDWLAEWCLPLVKKGGKMLAMKGPKIAEELPAAARSIRIVNGGEPVIHPVTLPGADRLVIVEIRKMGKTDPRYPRQPTSTKGKSL